MSAGSIGSVLRVEVLKGVEVLGWLVLGLGFGLLEVDGAVLRGDLKGVLNGERKGLESVWEAVSRRRRFAPGVDILVVLVLEM